MQLLSLLRLGAIAAVGGFFQPSKDPVMFHHLMEVLRWQANAGESILAQHSHAACSDHFRGEIATVLCCFAEGPSLLPDQDKAQVRDNILESVVRRASVSKLAHSRRSSHVSVSSVLMCGDHAKIMSCPYTRPGGISSLRSCRI